MKRAWAGPLADALEMLRKARIAGCILQHTTQSRERVTFGFSVPCRLPPTANALSLRTHEIAARN